MNIENRRENLEKIQNKIYRTGSFSSKEKELNEKNALEKKTMKI